MSANEASPPRSPATAAAAPLREPAVASLVEQVLSTCGDGAVLEVECGSGELTRALLREGVDARGAGADELLIAAANLRSPGRFHDMRGAALPFEGESVDTVTLIHCLEQRSDAEIDALIAEAARVCRRYAFVRLRSAPSPLPGPTPDRRRDAAWWRERFLAGWFRRHPLEFEVMPYESGAAEADLTLLFEKLPRGAAAEPADSDWLRLSNGVADAILARYALAPRFIRPGDVVVDLDAGVGAGAYLVQVAGRSSAVLAAGAAADLAIVQAGYDRAGQSYSAAPHATAPDVLLSLVEAIGEPEPFLQLAFAVLRPAGRLLAMVAPSDLRRFQEALGDRFLVEHIFSQRIAEIGLPRSLREASAEDVERGAAFAVLVAMKTPLGAEAAVAYQERVYDEYEHIAGCHLTAFRRDYDNPWLVRAMVAIGLRSENPAALAQLASQTLATARRGSADHGAALCVLAYRLLEGGVDATRAREFLREMEVFDESADRKPHAQRWRISNRFASGRLLMSIGDFPAAQQAFQRCAALDCLVFSPLLSTKTIEALLWAGRLALAAEQPDEAAAAWRRGLLEAPRVLQGDWSAVWGDPLRPAWFALAEVAQVVDLAARCGHALEMLDQRDRRPGLSRRLASESWAQRLAAEQRARSWIEGERDQWRATASCAAQENSELRAYLAETQAASGWHADQSQRWQSLATERDDKIRELHDWIGQIEQARQWLEGERQRLQSQVEKSVERKERRRD